jgi:hypothetical protein
LSLLYAVAAVATSLRQYITRDELIIAVGGDAGAVVSNLNRLLTQRLLTSPTGNQLRVRHSVIAERVVAFYGAEGLLTEPIRGLAFAMAVRTPAGRPGHSRQGRFLSQLINHDWLIRMIWVAGARIVYESIEEQLGWDYHYWLQRGSLEVERGSLGLAQNFLEQARALNANDYMVQTEWAYLAIKRAAKDPNAADARRRVDGALWELESAIAARGEVDSYPYHVMGSQGLRWIHAAELSQTECRELLNRLRSVVREGVRLHPRQRDLQQLASDLDHEYLMTAVDDRADAEDGADH